MSFSTMIGKKTVAWVTDKLSVLFTFILVYWTAIFISITVFEFKIFRENITETFYLSIIGILAILCGSAILNVITNISIIADNVDKNPEAKIPKRKLFVGGCVIIVSFFLVFAGLYLGDRRNSMRKERYLIASAERLYNDNLEKFSLMDRYTFSPSFILELGKSLRILGQQDENFQNVSVIIQDSIDKNPVFLSFGPRYSGEENEKFKKENYLLSTNMEEREYLNRIFSGTSKERRYSSSDGEYELYFPVTDKRTKFIIFLSERQKHGEYGS